MSQMINLHYFKCPVYLWWIPYSYTFMLAQRKCQCYEEIWKKKYMKILEIHWRTNIVGVFGHTEKLEFRLWLKDK
jgi:hypothetical protein